MAIMKPEEAMEAKPKTKPVMAPSDVDNVYVLSLGGYMFVLPLEDAAAILKHFSKAKRFDKEYISGGTYRYYLGGKLPEAEVKLLDADMYYEGLINGPKP